MITQREVWENLADSWTHLNVKPEEEVINFSKSINKGPVLDLGCGNCRNSLPFLERKIDCVGLDFSKGMIREAKRFLKKRNLKENLVIGSLEDLPFKKGSFLLVICIRTLHHLETRGFRLKALEEMKRVGIKILMSEWKRWQPRFIWQLIKSFFSGHFADVYVDWNYHGKIYKRFYHLYTKKELEDDLKNAGLKIEKIWYDDGNIWSSVIV
jgi:ubiquinone/menaquinone biosynthesis C-methylase UbiE